MQKILSSSRNFLFGFSSGLVVFQIPAQQQALFLARRDNSKYFYYTGPIL